MRLYVKNMVCHRCILAVEQILQTMNYTAVAIQLGEVEIQEQLVEKELQHLRMQLEKIGFELLNDKERQVVTQIKSLLIGLLQSEQWTLETPLSSYLAEQLNRDYLYLTQLFSQIESTTIEQYFIHLKIERVKELLVYDELTLKEISFQLNYSSVAHLSTQFKKITGMTPTAFKQLTTPHRIQIDHL
ncbi:helix-turn-helix transcriptional regulator [Myroides sp. 1354]|uniref:helix-turn-helix domain-containing protein n=1 Tax=unclassified Myroides TaxID=2642485 RepID=UPI002577B89E|nr:MULTISPECIES: AraC family transcriptional regulator [unclassified Myroides]MDM1046190.1 helix-turn-helix transcriptional regulator [Myroides sp. R163-1]MDM1057094.1 helix-turn-helix transcriptional regulator [Myroides sp. 1354]MDM1070321.1 helix-turn-helix transcriptional regulator [Myroides sp. 1372]